MVTPEAKRGRRARVSIKIKELCAGGTERGEGRFGVGGWDAEGGECAHIGLR